MRHLSFRWKRYFLLPSASSLPLLHFFLLPLLRFSQYFVDISGTPSVPATPPHILRLAFCTPLFSHPPHGEIPPAFAVHLTCPLQFHLLAPILDLGQNKPLRPTY